MTLTRLLVDKTDISRARLGDVQEVALADGQVRVAVERFALTANNITYAVFGDAMHYWDFFPSGEEGQGIVPVWGFGDVVQSCHPGVAVGERLYGYFPMAQTVVLAPTRLSPEGFSDASAHRAELHAVYNRCQRCACDPFYRADTEDLQALLRPLFTTSWLIDDFLADNDFFGARDKGQAAVMLLSSASSKTAYGTAFMLAQRKGIEVIGLTSAANKVFCEGLGCYHRVLTYDQIDTLPADTRCIYIDFAGNALLRLAVHTRFAQLAYSCAIGGTHVAELGGAKNLPGPKATLFFAPAQIKRRTIEWGAAVLDERLIAAWRALVERVSDAKSPWLLVRHHRGAEQALAVYREVLAGKADARIGHIVSMRP